MHKRIQHKYCFAGKLGVDVIDKLGCVSNSMLHVDALRKTYGNNLRHWLDNTLYMKSQETWGQMAAKHIVWLFLPTTTNANQRLALSTGIQPNLQTTTRPHTSCKHQVCCDFCPDATLHRSIVNRNIGGHENAGRQEYIGNNLANHPANQDQTHRQSFSTNRTNQPFY